VTHLDMIISGFNQFDFTFGSAKEEVVTPQVPADDMGLPF